MNILIFGGESGRHHQWVRDVSTVVEPYAENVSFLDYRHWQHGATEFDDKIPFDMEYELEQAAELAKQYGSYNVIAKSIGSVLTTLANSRGLMNPEQCIFLGFPLAAVTDHFPEVDAALPKLPPTIFLQNYRDPLGSFIEVRDYVKQHAPKEYECRQLAGDTHNYENYAQLVRIVKQAF